MTASSDSNPVEMFCPQHGLVGLGPPLQAMDQLASHFMDEHPDQTTLMEGADFTCQPAHVRCDLCCTVAEPPFWTYLTRRPLSEISTIPDTDGLWLVCDSCAELVELQDLSRLSQRAIMEHLRQSSLDDEQIRTLHRRHRRFVKVFLAYVQSRTRDHG
jgi:hypothetical protein